MFVLHNHSLRPNGDAVDNDVFEVGNEAYVPVITLGRFLWPPDHPMEVREKAQSDVPWTTAFPAATSFSQNSSLLTLRPKEIEGTACLARSR